MNLFSSFRRTTLSAVLTIILSLAGTAHAAVVFSDDFNGENGGAGALNYTGFANWNVTAPSVDLIGNGSFDFLPGNGLYVDMTGSTGTPGELTSKLAFGPGTYTLSFDLAGSQRGITSSLTVALGDLITTLTRDSSDPFITETFTVNVAAASTLNIIFESLNGGNIGALLDNIELSTVAVPEPASLALFGAGLLGLGFVRRRRNNKSAEQAEA